MPVGRLVGTGCRRVRLASRTVASLTAATATATAPPAAALAVLVGTIACGRWVRCVHCRWCGVYCVVGNGIPGLGPRGFAGRPL